MAGAGPPNADEIIKATFHFTLSEYTTVAGAVIYYYDLLLTWSTELELLWQRGSKLIKTVYLINRYLPMIGLPTLLITVNPIRTQPLTRGICTGVTVTNVVCLTVGTMCTTTLFTLRIRSLFIQRRWIRRTLLVLLLLSHATMVALTFAGIRILIKSMTTFNGGCLPSESNPTAGGNYAPPLIIELVVLGFTMYHALTFKKSTRMLETSQSKGILRRLYLEGTFYFIIVAGLRLWSALMFAFAPASLGLLSLGMDYAITGTVTSRFFLNLRQSIVDASSHDNTQQISGGYPGTGVIGTNGRTMNTMNGQTVSGQGQRRNSKMISHSHSQRRIVPPSGRFIRSHDDEMMDSNGRPRMAVISSIDLESARAGGESKDGFIKASGSDGDIELDSFGTRTPK